MRSPFQSEPEAFRFVLVVVLGLLPVALAAALGPGWLVLVVLGVVLCAVAARAVQLHMRKLRGVELPVKMAPPHLGSAADRRVLVVATDTLAEEALVAEIDRLASRPQTSVLVLVPALPSDGARLTGAIDGALAEARARLTETLERLGHHRDLTGEVSEADPLEAIEDAFATFVPDEVIVSTRWARGAGRLEPLLAGIVRERFAVPVRHLVFEPGAEGVEPNRDTEARYRRQLGEAAARRFGLAALAGAGILTAMVMSMIALIRGAERNDASATAQPAGAQVLSSAQPRGTGASAKVVELKVIAEGKKGPEGQLHDDFTVTEFHVTVGQAVTLRIDNTDTVPHSITSQEAGVNIVAQPGTHGYTLVVDRAGRFEWNCMFPCDPWSMQHVGYMRGFITATAS
ncbi:MAG: hypothetical protein ACYDA6_10305 [Solirubrobacteraceae bacterium]